MWHKCAGTGRGAAPKARKPEQTESSPAHFLLAKRTAGTVAENERALEADPRLLLGKSDAHRRKHVHLAFAVRGLREPLAETSQVPRDDDDAAIKVDVLASER